MSGVSSRGGHGRRARRDGPRTTRSLPLPLSRPAGRRAVGPVTGWVAFTLLVTAAVLLVLGVDAPTVLALLAAGAVLGLVLLLAARLAPAERDGDVTPGDGGPS